MSDVCVLSPDGGDPLQISRVRSEAREMRGYFERLAHSHVVMETGGHSPWVARLARSCGHEVSVVDARRLRMITHDVRKSDRRDCETLARLARADLGLLRPIHVRSEATHEHRSLLRLRDAAVRSRTLLVNSVRGTCKSHGEALPRGWSTPSFPRQARERMPAHLRELCEGLLAAIESMTRTIDRYERQLSEIARAHYTAEMELLTQVPGVGELTALCFVLAIEDPRRFDSSRQVAAYLGLVPRRAQSGAKDPRLGITKTGDAYTRRLLVSAACYIIHSGPDCALQRVGRSLRERGGRAPGKRAAVAVARKLAVVLHRMWTTGEVYDPKRGQRPLLCDTKDQMVAAAGGVGCNVN